MNLLKKDLAVTGFFLFLLVLSSVLLVLPESLKLRAKLSISVQDPVLMMEGLSHTVNVTLYNEGWATAENVTVELKVPGDVGYGDEKYVTSLARTKELTLGMKISLLEIVDPPYFNYTVKAKYYDGYAWPSVVVEEQGFVQPVGKIFLSSAVMPGRLTLFLNSTDVTEFTVNLTSLRGDSTQVDVMLTSAEEDIEVFNATQHVDMITWGKSESFVFILRTQDVNPQPLDLDLAVEYFNIAGLSQKHFRIRLNVYEAYVEASKSRVISALEEEMTFAVHEFDETLGIPMNSTFVYIPGPEMTIKDEPQLNETLLELMLVSSSLIVHTPCAWVDLMAAVSGAIALAEALNPIGIIGVKETNIIYPHKVGNLPQETKVYDRWVGRDVTECQYGIREYIEHWETVTDIYDVELWEAGVVIRIYWPPHGEKKEVERTFRKTVSATCRYWVGQSIAEWDLISYQPCKG